MTRATILIPAHNEAMVIGRTLLHLSRGLPFGAFRIVVIANGCIRQHRGEGPLSAAADATVLETATAGKCQALNLGYAAADRGKPVICLDADLDVTAESLLALIQPVENGIAKAACGQMDVRTDGAAATVRAYYRGWRTNPYFDRGKFGGLFALSPAAARRIFPLPAITADDEYVRRSFEPSQIAFVPGCRFMARAPATLASLVRVRRRSLRGAREVARMGKASPERGSAGAMVRRALRSPAEALPIAFFLLVTLWVRLSLIIDRRSAKGRWERDLTTRVTG
jgi:glycosyltransferase involved in cell wall biosynthesis